VKGEVERDVRALGYPSLAIVRPSLLLGQRAEFRPVEVLMGFAGVFAPAAWRPVRAGAVAAALVYRVAARRPGLEIVANEVLRSAGRDSRRTGGGR
jgi:uncharacterized protein YbjT (DUF2867 family)